MNITEPEQHPVGENTPVTHPAPGCSVCRMLLTTNMRVQKIAGQFGCANSSKFAAAFPRVLGVTPNEYRTQ